MTWAKLRTAYGAATGLDTTIGKLGSKSADQRSRALRELEGCIAHQGTIYSASAPAFTAILAHLVAPKTADRPAIAKLLAKIAWGRGPRQARGRGDARAVAPLATLLDQPDRDDRSRRRLLGAFVAIGGVLDPAEDHRIPVDWFDRALHPHIPPARLEARVYAHLCGVARSLGEPDRGHWGIGFARPAESAARFLAHCPTKRLAQLVLGLGGLSGIWGDCEEEVEKHAQHPAVRAALKEFRARVARVNSYGVMRKKVADWVADAV